jgi:hypothetical protein
MSKSSSSSSGIGFAGVLTIVLLVLKVTGYIAISWWVVFSPIWVTALLIVVALSVMYWAIK